MSLASVATWLPLALAVAFGMELWARVLHGKVWHRWLWSVHKSHHQRRRGKWEANDAFAIVHAPAAIALILYGSSAPGLLRDLAFGLGLGMTLFGVAYAVVHDGFIHGRLPVAWLSKVRYFEHVRIAHERHHRGGRGGAPYGLFLGPWESPSLKRRASSTGRSTLPSGR